MLLETLNLRLFFGIENLNDKVRSYVPICKFHGMPALQGVDLQQKGVKKHTV